MSAEQSSEESLEELPDTTDGGRAAAEQQQPLVFGLVEGVIIRRTPVTVYRYLPRTDCPAE